MARSGTGHLLKAPPTVSWLGDFGRAPQPPCLGFHICRRATKITQISQAHETVTTCKGLTAASGTAWVCGEGAPSCPARRGQVWVPGAGTEPVG